MAGSAKQQRGGPYKYLVLPGNESVLMREAMERRAWWQPAKEGETRDWNFWWGGNGQKFDQFSTFAGGRRGGCDGGGKGRRTLHFEHATNAHATAGPASDSLFSSLPSPLCLGQMLGLSRW